MSTAFVEIADVLLKHLIDSDTDVSVRLLNDFIKLSLEALQHPTLHVKEDAIMQLSERSEQIVRDKLKSSAEFREAFTVGTISAISKAFILALKAEYANIGVSQGERYSKKDLAALERALIIVKKYRGITHQDFADCLSWNKSQLSQFMQKYDFSKYFFSQKIGREKYYYISLDGETLLNNLVKQRTQIAGENSLASERIYISSKKRRKPVFEDRLDMTNDTISDNRSMYYYIKNATEASKMFDDNKLSQKYYERNPDLNSMYLLLQKTHSDSVGKKEDREKSNNNNLEVLIRS